MVLVVEDDDTIRRLIAELLNENGIAVKQAANGAEALRFAVAECPPLVILDVALPDVDGVQVAHQLRALCGPDLPILAITAGDHIAECSFEMGAFSGLEKPFELEHLLIAVRRGLLERAHNERHEDVRADPRRADRNR